MPIARKLVKSGAAALLTRLSGNQQAQTIFFNAARLNRAEFAELYSKDELRFLAYVFAMRADSRSQILQDLWVCFELDRKRNGYFVEFGATNGKLNSNTWILEKRLGWTGILAEPNPFWHADLANNRQCHIEHRCVSSKSGQFVEFTTTDDSDPELGGISSFSIEGTFDAQRNQGRRIKCETISLDDLLDEYQAPADIDYISIDTEGNELDIISNYSFKRNFSLLSVEQNAKTEAPIEEILKARGYTRVFRQFSQWDGWYVSPKLRMEAKPEIFAPLR